TLAAVMRFLTPGESQRAQTLRNRVLAKARPRGERRLEDAYYENYQNYEGGYDYGEADGQAADDAYAAQGGDDAYANQVAYTDDAYNGGGSSSYSSSSSSTGFDFDPSAHSLAYQSCASIRQFDDALAATEDSASVFATKHFAVVRLCPSSTCEEGSGRSFWSTSSVSATAFQATEGGGGGRGLGSSSVSSSAFERLGKQGANGGGCTTNYAEYILELGDYLEIMAAYRAERFEEYCDACNECLYAAYESWLNEHRGRRKLKDITDPTWKDDMESAEFKEFEMRRKLDGDYDPYSMCPEYDTCKSYRNACRNGAFSEEVETYFQCTEAVGENGYSYYIGPRCSEDGITIKLGVFGDEGCNEYLGATKVSVASLLGYSVADAQMAAYASGSLGLDAQGSNSNGSYDTQLVDYWSPSDRVCVRCLPKQAPSGYSDGSSNQDASYGQLNALCETIHETSARCTMNLQEYASYSYESTHAMYASEAADELACNFIEAIVLGSTNSMGFIATSNGVESLVPYSAREKYRLEKVSVLQIFGLLASMLACAVLFLLSKSLKHSLHKGHRPHWIRRQLQPQDELLRVGNEYIIPTQSMGEQMEVEVLHTNLDNLHREIDDLTKTLAAKNDALSSHGGTTRAPLSQGSSGRGSGIGRSRTAGRVKKIFGKKAKTGRTVSSRDRSVVSDVTFY
ncbi:hypothetical protein ACHAXT_009386, partial [Thalassiosira profunda]